MSDTLTRGELLAADIDYVASELVALSDAAGERALDADEQKRWDDGRAFIDGRNVELKRWNEAQELRRLAVAGDIAVERPDVQIHKNRHDAAAHPLEVLTRAGYDGYKLELRDASLRLVETRLGHDGDAATAAENLIRGRRDMESGTEGGSAVVEAQEHILRYGNDDYVSAFSKYVDGQQRGIALAMSPEELRAFNIGSAGAGAAMVPTHLDPTVVLSNNGTVNGIRDASRVVMLTSGSAWNGISSAGITVTWDDEAEEVAETGATFVPKAIPVWRATAYMAASIESVQDMAVGTASIVTTMIADGYERALAGAYATGNGTDRPKGVVTALDAIVGSEVATAVASTFSKADLYKLRYVDVPARFRGRASFVMNSGIESAVRQFGADDPAYAQNMLSSGLGSVLGSTIYNSEDMASAVADDANIVVHGDMQGYVIVDKLGTTIEYVQHVFGANQRPTGQRGWVAYGRFGADVHVPQGLRLLQVTAA